MIEDSVGVVGFVGDDMAGRKSGKQRDAQLWIAGVAASEDEAHWPAEGVDRDMPFGSQSSSGAPQSLVAEPPF